MQKNDDIVNIVLHTITELKSLIASQSVAVFILTEENAKEIGEIEQKSNSIFHQRFMLESGKMIDAVCNMPGEVKTCFRLPDEMKYGYKDQQFLGQPIINNNEEI